MCLASPGEALMDNTTVEYLEKISNVVEDKVNSIKEDISNILAARDAAYEENLIKRTSREIATLSLHLVEKETETLALKAREAEHINRIASLEAERDQLRNTVNLVFSSSSWKLTAPLRKLVQLLKR